jgi:hypothetical protein
VGQDLALELGGLRGGGLDPAGEAAEDEPRGKLVGRLRARPAETAAALDEAPGGEFAELLAAAARER